MFFVFAATTLMMRFGKEKNLTEDMERFRWRRKGQELCLLRRLVKHPVLVVEASWRG